MRKEYILLGLVALAGCATKPPRPDQLRAPTPERVLAYQDRFDGDATVIVTRDAGFEGSACYAAVFVDGKIAAKLDTAERASFYLQPGEHILGTWYAGSGLCSYRDGKDRNEIAVSLKSGGVKKFRIMINPGSSFELKPTTL